MKFKKKNKIKKNPHSNRKRKSRLFLIGIKIQTLKKNKYQGLLMYCKFIEGKYHEFYMIQDAGFSKYHD